MPLTAVAISRILLVVDVDLLAQRLQDGLGLGALAIAVRGVAVHTVMPSPT